MKTIRKCGPTIESIKLLNETRKGCLPENCKACRFFKANDKDDGFCGWCNLARGRLIEVNFDDVDCPLDFLEGVDERIWGIEDTNPWHAPWRSEIKPVEILRHREQKIEKLLALLNTEMKSTREMVAKETTKEGYR